MVCLCVLGLASWELRCTFRDEAAQNQMLKIGREIADAVEALVGGNISIDQRALDSIVSGLNGSSACMERNAKGQLVDVWGAPVGVELRYASGWVLMTTRNERIGWLSECAWHAQHGWMPMRDYQYIWRGQLD